MPDSPLILNVDDYQPARYARTRLLNRAGFRVEEAATGSQALGMLKSKPELVLLDVNLPDLSGFEVCRRIKQDPDTAGMIVMHLSASNTMAADKVKGLNCGADTYITEPVDDEVLVATIRSLLRARSAEEALRRANEDLENLTYMLSHELREPVRAVTTSVEFLDGRLNGKLEPLEAKFMEAALSGAHRLGTLIEGVLQYAHTVHEVRERATVDTEKALADAIEDQRLLITETGATIEKGPLPFVRASQTGLTRVFSNLISNAIKYRGAESPVIAINAVAQEDFWMFSVRDNGIGIDPAYHKKIFEVFIRLQKSGVSGSGIGLALCRRVIEDLGGKLWVDSASGKGSTFYFTLSKV